MATWTFVCVGPGLSRGLGHMVSGKKVRIGPYNAKTTDTDGFCAPAWRAQVGTQHSEMVQRHKQGSRTHKCVPAAQHSRAPTAQTHRANIPPR